MRRWWQAAAACLLLGAASANEFLLTESESQQCSGMYSKKAWGGNIDPQITLRFTPSTNAADVASVIIFEYEDEPYVGRLVEINGQPEKSWICTPDAVTATLCDESELGRFVLQPSYNTSGAGTIFTSAVHLDAGHPINYPIHRTGFYCVWVVPYTPTNLQYTGVITFQNSYGELPASQIAKLAFYGGLTIVYALVGALWAFLYVQHRRDILPVQNYITAIIIFLMVEMAITWVFYDYMNNHGVNAGSKVLMTLVSVLNAGRNSFSFFLLLIVCMGYGVVKPSLGGLMKWIRILALAHFLFGVVYAVASYSITPENAGPFVMLVILPLAATLTAFYVWTLNALKLTMKELEERKQHQKGLMYRRLWWALLISIFVIFGFFFLNSLTFAGHGSPDFVPTHWKTRWFVLDGWLNLVYLADLIAIAYLWRPTANNRRFAMSDELAQDDDGGFEIASIGGSDLDDDEDDDDERRRRRDVEATAGLSAPAQQQPRGRVSIEEPIFEVGGEGDGWSDGEVMSDSDDEAKKGKKGEEKKRLTGKKD